MTDRHFLAATLSCVFLALGQAASGQTSQQQAVGIPAPWFDVTRAPYGAKCDGSTDDTAAIQAALTAASAARGSVFLPDGRSCKVSTLNMNTFTGVSVIGGFGGHAFIGNKQSQLTFTGHCASAPCLSIQRGMSVHFSHVGLNFAGATSGPFIDLTDTKNSGFHGVAFAGPNKTSKAGPIVLDQRAHSITFDQDTSFQWAGVFVEGPADNNSGYSDRTTFDKVIFENPTIAAIQNASVAWTVRDSIYQMFQPGNTCTPFLENANGFNNQQALLIEGNVFNSAGGNCANTFNVFSLPSVSDNLGGATFISNLFIAGTSAGSQTEIAAGDGQMVTAFGNTFIFVGTAFSFGRGVSVHIGPNIYSSVSALMNGMPAQGIVQDNAGHVTMYPTTTGTTGAGAACTNDELKLGAGWGSAATVSGVAGLGQTCQWTITSNGAGMAANPTITNLLANPLPSAGTLCDMRMVGGTGAPTLINETMLSPFAPVFTFGGTPAGSGATYVVVRRCGP